MAVLYGVIRCHKVSYGVIRCHTVSYGVIRCHTVSYGVLRCHKVSYGVFRCHTVSYGVLRCHTVSYGVLRCHTVSYGVIRCHTGCPRVWGSKPPISSLFPKWWLGGGMSPCSLFGYPNRLILVPCTLSCLVVIYHRNAQINLLHKK